MAFSPGPKDAQISLSVFGGMVTEMSPPDLPEGVSPDCQDVAFAPGSVASRSGLQKVFTTPFPAGGPANRVPTVTYAKSYVTPTGGIRNLYLDATGTLWWEDAINSPGTYNPTPLTTLPVGCYARSITAFGREYIAPSDGLHGVDIPLQWDGTNLDRVTQEGPGAAPNVDSTAIASSTMQSTSVLNLPLRESDPASPDANGYFNRINCWTTASVASVEPGNAIQISGYTGSSAAMNGTWTVLQVFPSTGSTGSLLVLSAYLPPGTIYSTAAANGAIPAGSMIRQGNTVTVTTQTPHLLQVGYQAQISNVPSSQVGGTISSIVINNENLPGLATVTTSVPHGLTPGLFVSISGVNAASAGSISSISRAGNLVTVTTSAPHGLSPGALVTVSGVTPSTFNTTATVLYVLSPTSFCYTQVDVDATGSGGSISLIWPVPDTATPSYFEVVSAPTATTFQIAMAYSDGTWTGGTVSYAWDGTFFVTAVPSSTSFQYRQYGPDTQTGVAGTVTPYGQAAPGQHQMQVHFLTRQGYITRPSPPVLFTANGGQYLTISNIPIGPPNVVARILAFTGAGGAEFFYIPAIPQENGQIVGTATQINDNTTDHITLDFSDVTLFRSLSVSTAGNDLASQIVLGGALGFGFYGSRLITWGQRNNLQSLLNMSFDGGYLPSASTLPAGWIPAAAGAGGSLVPGHYGQGWSMTGGSGSISQSFYQTATGVPIATPNTTYRLRAWVKGSNLFTVTISSATTGFSSTATINGGGQPASGGFAEMAFSAAMPSPIPPDLTLSISASGSVLIDELSILYAQTPYLDGVLFASYVDNPEAFDGVTGKFGPSEDAHKVMNIGIIRETLYLLTQDPGGRIHQTSDNGTTEPVGWNVFQVAANCGLLSSFGLTKSQADDSSASGGEEWFAWASFSGARIFGGDQPLKISQEIEPDWERINPAHNTSIWVMNDPVARVIYFGLPLTGAGAPDHIYVMNYRGLNTSFEIGTTGPIRIGYTGRLVATDHARKWTRWNLSMNGAAMMYRQAGALSTVFFAGNGSLPGTVVGHANCYTLNPAYLTDDDYGQIYPYYVTYFMATHDQEQALGLAGGRKMLAYMAVFGSGVGNLNIAPLGDVLSNAWKLTGTRLLSTAPTHDMEWAGGNAQAQRIALKFQTAPLAGQTDNQFNLQKVTAWFRKATHLPVRGSV